jgi:DNA-binding CsgD family transcriptional regulator
MPRTGRPTSWTPEQYDYLKRVAFTRPYPLIAQDLGKNKDAVRYHLDRLGLPRKTLRRMWTSQEEARLKRLLDEGVSPQEIGFKMGRSEHAIRLKAHKLTLAIGESGKPWTREEICKLYVWVDRMSFVEIARRLDRTYRSVTAKATKLGIRWSNGKRTLREIAEEVGVHSSSVRKRAARLGLQVGHPGPHHYAVPDATYDALMVDFEEHPPRRR